MKVISLVPSWTETLIEAGVEVVGRTRFCIHPEMKIASIPAVGGTKKVDWEAVKKIEPDFVLMDREENTKEMAEACPYPLLVTHIEKIADVGPELLRLAESLRNQELSKLALRWSRLKPVSFTRDLETLPGVLQWLRRPETPPKQILYLIWKKPWMAAGKGTFISSVLEQLGLDDLLGDFGEKYPKIQLEDFPPEDTLLLFSSEPYPFNERIEELKEMPYSSAIVDGESYSWFGSRSLRFLESIQSSTA